MLEFLYRRLAKGFLPILCEELATMYVNDVELKKFIDSVADDIVNRQIAKISGNAGKIQQIQGGMRMPRFSLNNIIGQFIFSALNKKMGGEEGSNPESGQESGYNPYK